MYRITPITYLVNGMVTTGVAGASIHCSATEIVHIEPPQGQACGVYLHDYLLAAGASLSNPEAVRDCQVCPVSSTDAVLTTFGMNYHERWRSFGISLAYILFNISGALALYWAFRVRKNTRRAERYPQVAGGSFVNNA